MATYPVSYVDIEARWRPLSEAEIAVANELIDDAEIHLDARRPRVRALVNSGVFPVRLVVSAIAEAVQRVLRNPDLLRAQNLTGDGGVGLTYGLGEDTNHSLPRVRMSDDDLYAIDAALLAVPGAPARVRSQKLVVE